MALNWIEEGGQVLIQGASRGIGLELVRQSLEQPRAGCVWASCRAPEQATALHELADRNPERLRLLKLDVTDEATMAAAADRLREAGARLQLIVHASGVLHERNRRVLPEKRLEELNLEALTYLFQVNAAGPILATRYLLPLVHPEAPAAVAAISARVGSIGDNRKGGWYGYRASKAALNQFMHTLAIELQRRAPNVTCLTLHPGTTDTDLSRPFQAWVPAEQLFATERTAAQLLAVIDGCPTEESGSFFSWDGQRIPW